MKTLLALLLLIPSLSWAESIIYSCKYTDGITTWEYPHTVNVKINFKNMKLEKYFEDDRDLTNQYYCETCKSINERIEIWTKEYNPHTLNKVEIDNARAFEIYSNDLVGHLWRPFKSGVNYKCGRF